ncbi:hypothetical protein [Melghiribacillus thermohalophilus]|uniref:hypothetical protein n=1 Tax=Melghiribacillus thermohalophilus TaxID=1324956 RepID=UPI0010464692|nr:hypothetical protein [Melghiribacillus thermohalophilus]
MEPDYVFLEVSIGVHPQMPQDSHERFFGWGYPVSSYFGSGFARLMLPLKLLEALRFSYF